jgi:L-serine dehydratase
MFLSVFDMFKIGIGPSSSHTVGPMVAARRFLDLAAKTALPRTGRLTVTLHGSLAFTGKGHGTDRAVVLGLAGETPQSMDPDRVEEVLRRMAELGHVAIAPDHTVSFNPARDVIFDFGPALKGHANGMVFRILDDGSNTLLAETFFSIGGGFVQTEAERATSLAEGKQAAPSVDVPYPFRTAAEMLEMGRRSGLTVAEMKRANERVTQGDEELDVNLDHIWSAMRDCMNRGLVMTGTLPGGLKVKRRAAEIHTKLRSEQGNNPIQPHQLMDWHSV